MGGGLMQLVATGAQDVHLTGNPQITFFKSVYKKHTNFSVECILQSLTGTTAPSSAGASASCVISRNGDLLGQVYVRCDQDNSNGISGDNLIKDVKVLIGGTKIDQHTQEWLQIWNELTTPVSKSHGLKYLTGGFTNKLVQAADGSTLTAYNPHTLQQSIIVPLQFWFCRNMSQALPLIALQYHEVKLEFNWGSPVATDGTGFGRDHTASTPTLEVWGEYVYLDNAERRRFAESRHEYLIEQVQYQDSKVSTTSIELNFNHPVKELIWTTQSPYGVAESSTVISQKVKLQLNNQDRFREQDREYFQIYQPLKHHTSVPGFNIKEFDDPVMIAPIDTGVTTHNATVADGAAKLEATQITFDSTQVAAADAVDGAEPTSSAVRVGDVLKISVGGGDGDAAAAAETMTYVVQIKSISDAADPVCVFSTAIPAAQFFTNLANADGMSVHIIGRTQNPRSNCSSLFKDVNVYSFALKPEDLQPSGTCNFSRLDRAHLILSSSGRIETIYAVNYNVLRIMSGMGGLAYSN